MMDRSAKRTSEKILKNFGVELFDSHVTYVDGFSMKRNVLSPEHFRLRKYSIRRLAYICVIIILLLAMTVAVCGALGINIFNFHYDHRPGHAFLLKDNDESGKDFYRPDYVVDGYRFDGIEELDKGTRIYAYVNEENQYYSIQEERDASVTIDINTEDCDIEEKIVGDIEVKFYHWRTDSSCSAYFVKNNTFFIIHGCISQSEMISIINSLKLDR